ncbi:MAG: hypothetical protein PHS79_02325 [Patescibacteria group bacterium]|nr:hypothetical protein [Patescibacteria group bacterium]
MPLSKQPTTPAPKSRRTAPDGRLIALLKIIRWQGTAIVLLFVAVVLVIVVKKTDIKLPSQEPLQTPPPLTEKGMQYNVFAYHGTQLIKHGGTVTSTDLTLMGQVYDYKEAIKKWPELSFKLNGAAMQLSESGNYLIQLTLKPGPNIIETEVVVNGQEYSRRQMVVTYEPKSP